MNEREICVRGWVEFSRLGILPSPETKKDCEPTKCASTTLTQIFMVRFCFRLRSHLSFPFLAFHLIHGSDEDDCSWIMKCCNLQAGYQQNEKITDVWMRVEKMGHVKWRLRTVEKYVWLIKKEFERFIDDLRRWKSTRSFITTCWCSSKE